MYVVWHTRKLGARRRSTALRRGVPCRHAGARRYTLLPYIVRFRRGQRGRFDVVASLPGIRSCCLKSPEVRRAWWAKTDLVLKTLRWNGRRRREEVNIAHLEEVLRRKIKRPRPAPVPATTPTIVIAPPDPPQPATCWNVLGLPPGSGAPAIRTGLNVALNTLNSRGACLSELRDVHHAAEECLARLASGNW